MKRSKIGQKKFFIRDIDFAGIDIKLRADIVAGSDDMDEEQERQTGVIAKIKNEVKRPKMYKVLLHNDDYTTMEFVVFILQRVFHKSFEEAQKIMLLVHNDGVGVCGTYTHEIAEAKVNKVLDLAKKNEHPLQCSMEEE